MININLIISILLIFLIPSLVTGPFLPDLFLSLIGILFLVKYFTGFNNYDFNEKIKKYFYLFFTFYFFILISSFLSNNIFHSLESSLFYFRFGIFALVIPFIINENKKILYYSLIVGTVTFLVVSVDGIYEYINGSNIFNNKAFPGRIAGLFGDEWVIGSFISRILPVIIFLYFINFGNLNKFFNIIFFITLIISLITIILSGERAAYLYIIIILGSFLLINFKNNFLKLRIPSIIFLILSILILSLPFILNKSTDRILSNFNTHTSLDLNTNYYLAYYNSAYEMFLDKPLLGHGAKSFRILCDDFKNYENGCNMHPHNTYFQLLSEVGIIGFFYIFTFFIYIFFNIIKILLKKNISNYDICKYSLLISMLLNTFPLVPTGSFFNNWLSVIYYIPIGFYLYLLAYKKDILNSNFKII
ncbi:MAG: O-antigen ligase family protein [Alphaproteobacteria bacterium]|nr:O-antigen ligase family protein [Alphaproteobacteria bacterium]